MLRSNDIEWELHNNLARLPPQIIFGALLVIHHHSLLEDHTHKLTSLPFRRRVGTKKKKIIAIIVVVVVVIINKQKIGFGVYGLGLPFVMNI